VPSYKWGRFNFKAAKVVKRFARQGQKCAEYALGPTRFTRCNWTGAFAKATVVRRYNKGPLRCFVWKQGAVQKTVCWNNKLNTIRKFKQGKTNCTLYQRLWRQYAICDSDKAK